MLVSLTALFSATAIAGNGDTTETIQTRAGDLLSKTDFHGIPTQELSVNCLNLLIIERSALTFGRCLWCQTTHGNKPMPTWVQRTVKLLMCVESHESKP
ncbi:hypothetical protein O9993_01335 [Vibrio lentus]|nr:hypothetical protein [Vibrio lentus]